MIPPISAIQSGEQRVSLGSFLRADNNAGLKLCSPALGYGFAVYRRFSWTSESAQTA
jgi:hypothetical protein